MLTNKRSMGHIAHLRITSPQSIENLQNYDSVTKRYTGKNAIGDKMMEKKHGR